jgi:hypothetical protein
MGAVLRPEALLEAPNEAESRHEAPLGAPMGAVLRPEALLGAPNEAESRHEASIGAPPGSFERFLEGIGASTGAFERFSRLSEVPAGWKFRSKGLAGRWTTR